MMNSRLICGRRVRVELSTGKSRHEKRGFRMRDGPGGPRGGYAGGLRDGSPRRPRGDPYVRGMPDRGPPGPNGPAGGRYDDRYAHRGRGYSR